LKRLAGLWILFACLCFDEFTVVLATLATAVITLVTAVFTVQKLRLVRHFPNAIVVAEARRIVDSLVNGHAVICCLRCLHLSQPASLLSRLAIHESLELSFDQLGLHLLRVQMILDFDEDAVELSEQLQVLRNQVSCFKHLFRGGNQVLPRDGQTVQNECFRASIRRHRQLLNVQDHQLFVNELMGGRRNELLPFSFPVQSHRLPKHALLEQSVTSTSHQLFGQQLASRLADGKTVYDVERLDVPDFTFFEVFVRLQAKLDHQLLLNGLQMGASLDASDCQEGSELWKFVTV